MKCLAVRRSWARGGAVLVAALATVAEFAFAHSVHAQQFIAADLTYTATTQNTTNSEYRVPVLAGAPANWKSPVDYTQGMAYVRFEVLDKPSDAKTLYNVCFALAGSKLSCMPYSPVFTGKGVNNFSAPFSAFWNADMVDWTMGVMQIVLVLKDDTGKLVQGDANYYPSTIKTQLTLVAPGATYVPPKGSADAGTMPPKDAGMPKPDASMAQDAGMPRDAGTPVQDAGAPVVVDAGTKPVDAGRVDASAAGSGTGNSSSSLTQAMAGTGSAPTTMMVAAQDASPEHDVRNYLKSSGNCSIAGAPGAGPKAWLALLALPLLRARRARGRRRRAVH